MKSLEMFEARGFEILEILHSFEEPLRSAIWVSIVEHPIYAILDHGVDVKYVVVTGKWLRKLIGHVAVETDMLSEFRRKYPPIVDGDLVYIRRY
jgi:hypothetical protein